MFTSCTVVQIRVSNKVHEIVSLACVGSRSRHSAGQMARRTVCVAYKPVAVTVVASLVRKSQVDVSAKRPLQRGIVFASNDVAGDGYVAVFPVQDAVRPYLDAHLVAARMRVESAASVRAVAPLQRVVVIDGDRERR